MSHRITIDTKITDREVAHKALQAKGWAFNDRGDEITVTSGPMAGATINIKTGVVAGDSDWHRQSDSEGLGALNQAYSEELVRRDCTQKGGYLESEQTQENGDRVLVFTGMSFA